MRYFIGILVLSLSFPVLAEQKKHRAKSGVLNGASTKLLNSAQKQKAKPRPSGEAEGIFKNESAAALEPISPKQCNTGIPIETFVQISSSYAPQVGKTGVYFLSDLRETPQVFYLKAPGEWPQQISFFPDGVPFYLVSPDKEKILIATHQGGDEQYDLYLAEPSKGNQITPLIVDRTKRIESISWGPKSDRFFFTSNARNKIDFDLYQFELSKNVSEILVQLPGSNTVADVSPDGRYVALTQFRSVTDSDVLVWDFTSRTIRNLTNNQGGATSEAGDFTADSKGLFHFSDKDTGMSQLYLLTLDGSKPPKVLTSEKGPVESMQLNQTRTALAYEVNEEGYGKLGGFQISASGLVERALSLPPHEPAVRRSPRFSPGKEGSVFFAASSSSNTGDIWEWRNKKLIQWTKSTQALISPECLVKEKLIKYPSFDHREIPAFLFRPANATGPIPFIVYVHGGPESQYRPMFSKTFQYFLQRGFGVLAPNIRGSTGYGRQYTLLDNYKLRMDSVSDVVEGAKWLISSGQSKKGQLAIYGGSYGGFLVLRSIEVEPDLFAAASESVGIANFVTFLKNTKSYRRALREVEYGPLSDEEFLKSISPMTYIDKIKTPLMIFHGANDPRVPVSEAEQLIAELKKRGVTADAKIFADEGHGNTKLRNILEQARLMTLFFEQNMKAAQ